MTGRWNEFTPTRGARSSWQGGVCKGDRKRPGLQPALPSKQSASQNSFVKTPERKIQVPLTSQKEKRNFKETGKSRRNSCPAGYIRKPHSGAGREKGSDPQERTYSYGESSQLVGISRTLRRTYPSLESIAKERGNLLTWIRSQLDSSLNRISESVQPPPQAVKRTYAEVLKSKPEGVTTGLPSPQGSSEAVEPTSSVGREEPTLGNSYPSEETLTLEKQHLSNDKTT